jgi:hypothetical protein
MTHRIEKLEDTFNRKNWKIIFLDHPTVNEIYAIVEEHYPSEGYGTSIVSMPQIVDGEHVVFVSSSSSCD